MSHAQFSALQAQIEALDEALVQTPNMPVDKFLQEAANLKVWSTDDQPQLVAVGVPQTHFNSLEDRIGALRYAQSLWNKERHSQDEARQQWNEQLPQATDLKDQLEHSFRFAFRQRPDLLTKVRQIEAGSGNADLLQDLSDLSVLGKANLPLLQAISFDETLLDTAESTAGTMSTLLATMNGERNDSSNIINTRNKAYTYLKQAVDEIREAGKYVFWKDDNRIKGYHIQYFKNR